MRQNRELGAAYNQVNNIAWSYLTTRKILIGHCVWALPHYILKWAIPVAVFEAPPAPAGVDQGGLATLQQPTHTRDDS